MSERHSPTSSSEPKHKSKQEGKSITSRQIIVTLDKQIERPGLGASLSPDLLCLLRREIGNLEARKLQTGSKLEAWLVRRIVGDGGKLAMRSIESLRTETGSELKCRE